MNISFARMTMEDIDEVLAVEKLSFRTPWSRQAFEGELTQNPLAVYIVGRVDERIVCYGGAWLFLGEAHITNIAIHPDFRGHGFGEAVCRMLMQEAFSVDIFKVTLEVRESNLVALKLYRKLGFHSVGKRPGYYTDTKEDAVIMWWENSIDTAAEEDDPCEN